MNENVFYAMVTFFIHAFFLRLSKYRVYMCMSVCLCVFACAYAYACACAWECVCVYAYTYKMKENRMKIGQNKGTK